MHFHLAEIKNKQTNSRVMATVKNNVFLTFSSFSCIGYNPEHAKKARKNSRS